MTRPANSDDSGFTLTETLMALVVIGLALGGIIQVTSQVAKLNARAGAQQKIQSERRQSHQALQAKLQAAEPMVEDALSGDRRSFSFKCPDGLCSHTAAKGQVIRYASGGEVHDVWPPAFADEINPPRLEAILIEDNHGNILDVIKFMVDHSADCQFDMISRTCRASDAGEGAKGE